MRNAKLLGRLKRVKELPIAPAWALAAIEGRAPGSLRLQALRDLGDLAESTYRVAQLRHRLQAVPPAWPVGGSLL